MPVLLHPMRQDQWSCASSLARAMVALMTKKKNSGLKSLESMLQHLRSRLKKISLAKEVLPSEIADDPQAVMEWIRAGKTRRRRSRKWTSGSPKRNHER